METLFAIINCVLGLAVIAVAVYLIVTFIKMAKSIKHIENMMENEKTEK